MRSKKHRFPELRRAFDSLDQMAQAINRSKSYVNNRLNGRGEFTENDKKLFRIVLGNDSETLFAE